MSVNTNMKSRKCSEQEWFFEVGGKCSLKDSRVSCLITEYSKEFHSLIFLFEKYFIYEYYVNCVIYQTFIPGPHL